MRSRLVTVLGLALLLLAGWGEPASAQDAGSQGDESRAVKVSFDIGDYDESEHDWPVLAVIVSGDFEADKDFTVQVLGASDRVLWEATQPYNAPVMRFYLPERMWLRDVTATRVSQAMTLDPLLVEPDLVDPVAGGGGGTGQVATSMVLVIIIAVVLFRTPLPSAASQRWTK